MGAVSVGPTLDIRTVWLEPGEKIDLPPGAAVFAGDGRFAGLTSAVDGGTIIIPGADVLASAEELAAKAKPPLRRDELRRLARWLSTSAALGLPPVLAPAMVFVPLGVLLGPWGTRRARRPRGGASPSRSCRSSSRRSACSRDWRSAMGRAAASSSAPASNPASPSPSSPRPRGTPLPDGRIPLAAPAGVLALMLGVAAATSSTGFEDSRPDAAPSPAAGMADLDDVLPILIRAAALAWLQTA